MADRIQTQHEMILSVEASKMVADLERAEKELGDLARGFDRAQAQGKKFEKFATRQAANTNRALKGNRMLAQQASTQFGDFLVQVGGGQSALLAFSQQANQLGAFMAGPWGIAFTVATGVLAAFGSELFKSNEELEEYKKLMDDTAKATADYVRETERLRTGQSQEVFALQEALRLEQARLEVNLAAERTGYNWLRLNAERIGHLERIRELEAEIAARVAAEHERTRIAIDQRSVTLMNELLIYQALQDIANARLKTEIEINEALHKRTAASLDPFGGAGDYVFIPHGNFGPWGEDDNPPSSDGGSGVARVNDMEEALARAREQADQFGESMDLAFGTLATSALDQFIDGLVTGELAFKDFARAILQDLAKIMLRALIVQALMAAIGGVPGQAVSATQQVVQAMAGISQITPFAKGGIVTAPSMFPMAGGAGLMGESGPEAIMPLGKTSSGELGVKGTPTVVQVFNSTGASVDVQDGPDGQLQIFVGKAVDAARAEFARSMATGQGTYARSLEAGFHARRKAT